MTSKADALQVVLVWLNDPNANVTLEEVLDMAMTHAAFGQRVGVWLCGDSVLTALAQPLLNDKLTLLCEMGSDCVYDQDQSLPTSAPPLRAGSMTLRQQLSRQTAHSFTF